MRHGCAAPWLGKTDDPALRGRAHWNLMQPICSSSARACSGLSVRSAQLLTPSLRGAAGWPPPGQAPIRPRRVALPSRPHDGWVLYDPAQHGADGRRTNTWCGQHPLHCPQPVHRIASSKQNPRPFSFRARCLAGARPSCLLRLHCLPSHAHGCVYATELLLWRTNGNQTQPIWGTLPSHPWRGMPLQPLRFLA